MKPKDEWRSVIGGGEQSVMICGTTTMRVWCADSWDFLPQVLENILP